MPACDSFLFRLERTHVNHLSVLAFSLRPQLVFDWSVPPPGSRVGDENSDVDDMDVLDLTIDDEGENEGEDEGDKEVTTVCTIRQPTPPWPPLIRVFT